MFRLGNELEVAMTFCQALEIRQRDLVPAQVQLGRRFVEVILFVRWAQLRAQSTSPPWQRPEKLHVRIPIRH